MALTIAETLALEPLRRGQLLAGEAGLHRPVQNVAVLESGDSCEWVRGGELVLTKPRGSDATPAYMHRVLKELASRGASGVALPDHVSLLVEPELLHLADTLSLPLLLLPPGTAWHDISSAVLQEVIRRTARDQFFLNLLLHAGLSERETRERAFLYGIKPDSVHAVLVVRGQDSGSAALSRLQPDLPEQCQVVSLSDTGVVILPLPEPTPLALQKCLRPLQRAAHGSDLLFGVGNPQGGGAPGVRLSYEEATLALLVGTVLRGPGYLFHYAQTGVFRLLLQHLTPVQLQNFCQATLAPLLEGNNGPELIETAEQFFATGSLAEAAGNLHVHYNTAKYRLNRIEQLTGLDLRVAGNRLNLELAIQLKKMLPLLADRG